jgi:hypothetical protein
VVAIILKPGEFSRTAYFKMIWYLLFPLDENVNVY